MITKCRVSYTKDDVSPVSGWPRLEEASRRMVRKPSRSTRRLTPRENGPQDVNRGTVDPSVGAPPEGAAAPGTAAAAPAAPYYYSQISRRNSSLTYSTAGTIPLAVERAPLLDLSEPPLPPPPARRWLCCRSSVAGEALPDRSWTFERPLPVLAKPERETQRRPHLPLPPLPPLQSRKSECGTLRSPPHINFPPAPAMSSASYSGSGESTSCSEASDAETKEEQIPLHYQEAVSALAKSRRRAKSSSRRHHRRLAELHAVIAELLRRQQPARLHTLHEDSDCGGESGSEKDSDKEKDPHLEKDEVDDRMSSTSSINKQLSADNTDTNTSLPLSLDGRDGCMVSEVRIANRVQLKTSKQSIPQVDSASSIGQNTPDGSAVYDAEEETECDADVEDDDNCKKEMVEEDTDAQCLVSALVCCDRAVEAYDVLLALAESRGAPAALAASRRVARRLLRRLQRYRAPAAHRLTPGPWTDFHTCQSVPVSDGEDSPSEDAFDEEMELKKHIVRLKEFSAQARKIFLQGDSKSATLPVSLRHGEKTYRDCGDLNAQIKTLECENLRDENDRLRQGYTRSKRKYEHRIRQLEKQLQYLQVDSIPNSHILYSSETNL